MVRCERGSCVSLARCRRSFAFSFRFLRIDLISSCSCKLQASSLSNKGDNTLLSLFCFIGRPGNLAVIWFLTVTIMCDSIMTSMKISGGKRCRDLLTAAPDRKPLLRDYPYFYHSGVRIHCWSVIIIRTNNTSTELEGIVVTDTSDDKYIEAITMYYSGVKNESKSEM